MVALSGGIGVSYLMAANIDKTWAVGSAIAVVMVSAYFAQAGCGATFGMVPLIKKSVTGQIAGNVGAYGNFGGVVYLTVYSLTDAATLFKVMGLSAIVCAFVCSFLLREPSATPAAMPVSTPVG
jgi:MFS transporter, NNP family, nitrate/nitrite transporter